MSLAQFISETREKAGYSQTGLSKRANVDVKIIEDIESGRELFMSVTVRQRLAKALKLEPGEIKRYEKLEDISLTSDAQYIEEIREAIIHNNTDDITCPVCNSTLITKLEKMYDLEDNLVLHPKAHCSKCPFQVK